MKIVIYLLGFACIAYCTYFNLYTRQAANSLKNMFQTYQLKYLAAIPAVVSVLFIISHQRPSAPGLSG
jgi:hypothetical protein